MSSLRKYNLLLSMSMASTCAQGALQAAPNNKYGVQYEYNRQPKQELRPAAESTFGGNIEEIIGSSFLQANLKRGIVALDRSMHSLMESIFYSILDQDGQAKITSHNFLQFGTRRKVYRSRIGKWVVADRVFVGPRTNRHLGYIGPTRISLTSPREITFPVGLDAESILSFVEIYPSDSALPLVDRITTSKSTQLIRNWFGLLPLMEAVLPLIFNPVELYDPFHLAEVPFLYPAKVENFSTMPTGNIRSTSLHGGIRLPLLLDLFSGKDWEALIAKSNIQENGLTSVFFEGSYSVHVLKVAATRAKIGITWYRSKGLGFGTQLASTLYLFANSIPKLSWKGAPVYFMPIRANWKFESIFEKKFIVDINLDHEEGRHCYEKATLGDLSTAHPQSPHCTLSYDFEFQGSRKRVRVRQNILLSQSGNTSTRKNGIETIHTTDQNKQQYSYRYDYHKRFQNQLYGSWEEKYSTKTIQPKSEESKPPTLLNPTVEMHLHIEDKALYANELKEILNSIQNAIPFDLTQSLPSIPLRNEEALLQQQQNFQYLSARERGRQFHTLPQMLGHFSLDLIYLLNKQILSKILQTPSEASWQQLLHNFPVYQTAIPKPMFSSIGHKILAWPAYATGRLLESFYLDSAWLKAPYRATQKYDHLEALKHHTEVALEHEEYVINLGSLTESSSPRKWMETLIHWVGYENMPVKLFLNIQPAQKTSVDTKLLLEKYKDRSWQTHAYKQTLEDVIKDPSALFHPQSVGVTSPRPLIYKIKLYLIEQHKLVIEFWVDQLSIGLPRHNKPLMAHVQLEKDSLFRVSLNRDIHAIYQAEEIFDLTQQATHYRIHLPFEKDTLPSL
ncbi:MAG: hypothetical protein OXT67_07375, partial [Zetaproteobacteria bacterium]|nr:hypothetical protein [Zetaproteobacteria bacterium]